MLSDGTPPGLIPVRAGDGPTIHLAAARTHGVPGTTLCQQPSGPPVSAKQFHRLGCPRCAEEAVASGVLAIEDLHHATVNLPRFVAAQHHDGGRAAHEAPGQPSSA